MNKEKQLENLKALLVNLENAVANGKDPLSNERGILKQIDQDEIDSWQKKIYDAKQRGKRRKRLKDMRDNAWREYGILSQNFIEVWQLAKSNIGNTDLDLYSQQIAPQFLEETEKIIQEKVTKWCNKYFREESLEAAKAELAKAVSIFGTIIDQNAIQNTWSEQLNPSQQQEERVKAEQQTKREALLVNIENAIANGKSPDSNERGLLHKLVDAELVYWQKAIAEAKARGQIRRQYKLERENAWREKGILSPEFIKIWQKIKTLATNDTLDAMTKQVMPKILEDSQILIKEKVQKLAGMVMREQGRDMALAKLKEAETIFGKDLVDIKAIQASLDNL